MIYLVLEFLVAMTVTFVLWFRMSVMIVMNILVDMVAELNFQIDMMVEWDFQISVMNLMALVVYYDCFLDHQTILSQCHMIVACF